MLDIIIPVYNNYDGLAATLASFGTVNRIPYHFIIIDDASTVDYTPIIDFYSQWFDIQYYKLVKNSGPGVARNKGLSYATHDFITFIDAGDELLNSYSLLQEMGNFFMDEKIVMLCPMFIQVNENDEFFPTWHENDKLQGKIYKRSFISQYDIKFGEAYSWYNEEIAFNACCDLIIEANMDKYSCLRLQDPFTIQTSDNPESLTLKDNKAGFYKIQNMALAQNFIEALETTIKPNVPIDIYIQRIYSIFVSEWRTYIATINTRPEFTKEALDGAAYFYHKCFKNYPLDEDLLAYHYNLEMQTVFWGNDPFSSKLLTVSILDFIKLLKKQKVN